MALISFHKLCRCAGSCRVRSSVLQDDLTASVYPGGLSCISVRGVGRRPIRLGKRPIVVGETGVAWWVVIFRRRSNTVAG